MTKDCGLRIAWGVAAIWWASAAWSQADALRAISPDSDQVASVFSIGDLIAVEVKRHPDLSVTTTIDSTGSIELPYIGRVMVSGLDEAQATERVSEAFRRILKNPRVVVSRGGLSHVGGTRTMDMKTEVISLQNASAESLAESLTGMTSAGGSIGFDKDTNSLIVTDSPVALGSILEAISRLDQMQSQRTQVRIEAKIAEVQSGALKELGVRWFVQGGKVGVGYAPLPSQDWSINSVKGEANSPGANEQLGGGNTNNGNNSSSRRFIEEDGLDRRLQIPAQIPLAGQTFLGLLNEAVDLGVMIDALVSDQKAELLASPNILTVNHKTAEIRRVEEFPYTEYGSEFGRSTFSTKFLDLGIVLRVTPHVYSDEGGAYVKLELEPEVSFPVGSSNGVPIRSIRSSKSIASVRDGQTLVVGGIYRSDNRNVKQGVPGISKVPILGNLFKRTEKAKVQTELMVFVTPRVHESPETVTWDRMIDVSNLEPGASPQSFDGKASKELRQE